ncbi:MAG: zinc-ribbon domain containing protein [Acidaminococcaceae bacterium]|nr:zinc-ribbon domain containing protein [Acidaminococcaceae bacterium]MDO4936088.1 zinc-ribbon domain containing protein [Phascolarctobacterium sp.]
MKEDKTLTCADCGQEFVFSASEQEFYEEKGFTNEPKRCPACRKARKQQRNSNRVMHTTVCAACGKETTVPFEPKGDRPVYCRECFDARREN